MKTIMKESHKFELEKEEEEEEQEEEEKNFGSLATFWFGTFAKLFSTTGCVVRHENTQR